MNKVRSIIKTPASRTIQLKIPDFVPINEDIEVIMMFNNNSFQKKIEMLKNIPFDKTFLEDIKNVQDDYQLIDNKEWD
ncbi:hypothetical protein D9V86_07720 [Bacteroidetes/Chlorobi group bacterium ChocPot_Mid]|jgi:hypothetical protein|nr:MAG: hypothetical protein D9V86_07720 [Bacteroidetes/Chlorobi group bacterium ChocPot_Mid]